MKTVADHQILAVVRITATSLHEWSVIAQFSHSCITFHCPQFCLGLFILSLVFPELVVEFPYNLRVRLLSRHQLIITPREIGEFRHESFQLRFEVIDQSCIRLAHRDQPVITQTTGCPYPRLPILFVFFKLLQPVAKYLKFVFVFGSPSGLAFLLALPNVS